MDYIQEINYINSTNYTSDDISCSKCSIILVDQQYTNGTTNICTGCYAKSSENTTYTKTSSLINESSCMIFPCKFKYCDYFGKIGNILNHENSCLYGPIVCPYDKDLFYTKVNKNTFAKSDFVKHLTVHGQFITVYTNSLKLELTVNLASKCTIYLIFYKSYKFVMSIELIDNAMLVRMIQYYTCKDICINNFKIVHTHKNNEMWINGKIIGHRSSFGKSIDTDCDVMLPKVLLENNPVITLYISDYERLRTYFGECPVCMQNISLASGHCKNGHVICSFCRSKLTTCPTCRETLEANVLNLPRLFTTLHFQCLNSEKGCLELLSADNETEHLRKCQFATLHCSICDAQRDKFNIFGHIKDNHDFYENYSFHMKTFSKVSSHEVIIIYRSTIFYFKLNYNNDELKMTMLLEIAEDKPSKYRYEIDFFKNNTIVSRASNICSPSSNFNGNNFSSVMSLTPLRQIFYQKEVWAFHYQIKIIYCNNS